METHKRILGILFIVSGSLQILGMLFMSTFLSILLPLIVESGRVESSWILEWIVPFVQLIAVFVILFFSIPSIIGGWGLLQHKKWALTLVLIMGCFKLFSIPLGTALGVYTIWVYAEEHKTKPA